MEKDNSSWGEKRKYPRLEIELPVLAHVDGEKKETVVSQLVDISAQGMQLKMASSDFGALQTDPKQEGKNNRFEIRLTARLAWVMPDEQGLFKTGWEFNILDDEELIG